MSDELREDAFLEDAMERYGDAVYRLALCRLGSRADAEDVYQDVFLRLLRDTTAFRDGEHLKAWLLRVTLNCCKKLGASAWRRHVVPVERLPEHGQADDFEALALRDALARLPEKDRAALHLFYGEGLTAREIGAITGEKEASVRSRLSRARAQLRKEWEGGA